MVEALFHLVSTTEPSPLPSCSPCGRLLPASIVTLRILARSSCRLRHSRRSGGLGFRVGRCRCSGSSGSGVVGVALTIIVVVLVAVVPEAMVVVAPRTEIS